MLYENGNTFGNNDLKETGYAAKYTTGNPVQGTNKQPTASNIPDGSCIKGSVAVMIFFGVIIVIIVTAIAVGGLLFGGL